MSDTVVNVDFVTRVVQVEFDKDIAMAATHLMEAAAEAAASASRAETWAEGTDTQVEALGGEHSSKGWADVASGHASDASGYANDASGYADDAKDSAEDAEDSADAAHDALEEAKEIASVIGVVGEPYDPTKTYNFPDTVITSDGSTWRCIETSTGEYPATSSKWVALALATSDAFEYDANGDLQPCEYAQRSSMWQIDANEDVYPASV